MKLNLGSENQQAREQDTMDMPSRRRFLALAGGIAGVGVLVASCHKTPASTVFIGSDDRALLNYLLIIEELQTNFYTQASITDYYGASQMELDFIADMRDQQIARKGLLKSILGAAAIPDIVTDLSAVTFADRISTLQHAALFEDLAVAAYNGVIQYFADTSYALMVAKMASVNGRRAAYARDILNPNTLADGAVVNTSGLDQALTPKTVMVAITPYIQTTFNYALLPA